MNVRLLAVPALSLSLLALPSASAAPDSVRSTHVGTEQSCE